VNVSLIRHTDRATLEACGEAWSALLAQPGAPALQEKVQHTFDKLVARLLLQLKPLTTALKKPSSAQGDPQRFELVSEALVMLHRLESLAKGRLQPLPAGLSGLLGGLLQVRADGLPLSAAQCHGLPWMATDGHLLCCRCCRPRTSSGPWTRT